MLSVRLLLITVESADMLSVRLLLITVESAETQYVRQQLILADPVRSGIAGPSGQLKPGRYHF